MKKFVIAILLATGATFAMAQSNTILPGKSVGGIKIGMDRQEVEALIGEACAERTRTEEDKELIKFGKNIWQELRYNTHYDMVLEYQNADIPVRKLYFENDKLVYMTLTAFGYEQAMLERFKINGKPCMGCPATMLASHLGIPVFTEDYTHVQQIYYLNQGIDFVTHEGKIKAINIYEPIDQDVAMAIKAVSGY